MPDWLKRTMPQRYHGLAGAAIAVSPIRPRFPSGGEG
jgi:hypothetical protein